MAANMQQQAARPYFRLFTMCSSVAALMQACSWPPEPCYMKSMRVSPREKMISAGQIIHIMATRLQQHASHWPVAA